MPTVTSKNREKFIEEEMARKAGKKARQDYEKAKDWDEMSHEARELALHADNDQHLYRSSHIPIVKNLQRKMKKGEYDQDKARKLWGYHADRAAQSYHREFGTPDIPWHKAFGTEHRREAAHHFEEAHRGLVEDDSNYA